MQGSESRRRYGRLRSACPGQLSCPAGVRIPPATKRRVACQQALDGFVPDEAECRELVHALSGAASPEAGPSSEGGALLVGPPMHIANLYVTSWACIDLHYIGLYQ